MNNKSYLLTYDLFLEISHEINYSEHSINSTTRNGIKRTKNAVKSIDNPLRNNITRLNIVLDKKFFS